MFFLVEDYIDIDVQTQASLSEIVSKMKKVKVKKEVKGSEVD